MTEVQLFFSFWPKMSLNSFFLVETRAKLIFGSKNEKKYFWCKMTKKDLSFFCHFFRKIFFRPKSIFWYGNGLGWFKLRLPCLKTEKIGYFGRFMDLVTFFKNLQNSTFLAPVPYIWCLQFLLMVGPKMEKTLYLKNWNRDNTQMLFMFLDI